MENVTVLLADGGADSGISIEQKLNDQHIRLVKVSNEADIFSEIEKKQIDVVILNTMPTAENGLDALGRIKKLDPLVEVILCTDQADLSIAIKGMEMGAFDYILNSITPEELVHKIWDAHQKKLLQEEKIKKLKHTYTDTNQ